MNNKEIIIVNKFYKKRKALHKLRNHLLYTQIFFMINIYIIEKHLKVLKKRKAKRNKKFQTSSRLINPVNKLVTHVQVD